jgi:hypothetical protein
MAVEWELLCVRLGLTKMAMSKAMYGGDCPLCGAEKAFFVWLHNHPILKATCLKCKVKIKINDGGRESWPSPF